MSTSPAVDGFAVQHVQRSSLSSQSPTMLQSSSKVCGSVEHPDHTGTFLGWTSTTKRLTFFLT